MPKIPYYQEALSTLENAAELISSSLIDENYYTDIKKVKAVGKTIYKCIEKSARLYIELKGGEISKKADDREITSQLGKIDMHTYYVYNEIHTFFFVLVYSRGYNNSKRIKESIKTAKKFIKLLKPLEKTYKQHKSDAI
jgi:hypothetical protein